jgi:hypothetical protein
MSLYIGVDPGVNGGIAGIGDEVVLSSMPKSESDILYYFKKLLERDWICSGEIVHAVIEQVGGFMGGGGRNVASAHTMFKFGWSYGALRMALVAHDIQFISVVPKKWQKASSLGIDESALPPRESKETTSSWKGRLRKVARDLYPQAKITLKTSDALLLAHYCKLQHERNRE